METSFIIISFFFLLSFFPPPRLAYEVIKRSSHKSQQHDATIDMMEKLCRDQWYDDMDKDLGNKTGHTGDHELNFTALPLHIKLYEVNASFFVDLARVTHHSSGLMKWRSCSKNGGRNRWQAGNRHNLDIMSQSTFRLPSGPVIASWFRFNLLKNKN